MRRRLRDWLAETHGLRFELVRHFAAGLFDSEMFAVPGQWAKTATGLLAGVVPLSILALQIFWRRYYCLNLAGPAFGCPAVTDYQAAYLNLVRSDIAWLIGLAMCATALATAIQWQALFPSRRDLLALASLPARPLDLFAGKLASVAVAFAVFVLAMTAAPSLLFAFVIEGRWQPNPSLLTHMAATFTATASAAAFVFSSLLAFQAVLMNILPPKVFSRVTVYLQAAVFTLAVAAVPFTWPDLGAPVSAPVSWFEEMWRAITGSPGASARIAAIATAGAALFALGAYLAGYGRYERSLTEGAAVARRRGTLGAGLLERWITDPREQGMFAFIAKTLARSRTHRLVLLLYAGFALAWMAKGIADRSGQQGGVYPFASVFVPAAAALFAILALRRLFSMPAELRANWIFLLNESECREAWLRAIDRFVICCVLAPIYVCGAPAAMAAHGVSRGACVTLFGFGTALLAFEILFREWRKVPFACSYQPGKRPFWLVAVLGLAGLSYIATVAGLTLAFSSNLVVFAASFPIVLMLWRAARAKRREWRDSPLIFEDEPEAVVIPLDIGDSEAARATGEERRFYSASGFWDGDPTIAEEPESAASFFHWRGLLADSRYALRSICRNAALSSAIVAILALGIGLNVTVFAVINGALLRAPVPKPETFVRLLPERGGWAVANTDDYDAYRAATSLSALTAWKTKGVLLGNDHSFIPQILLASCNFFQVYGAGRPLAGRLFAPDDCARGGSPAIVLSEEAWRRRFSADPRLVGKSIAVDGRPFTVIGIAPANTPARIKGVEAWVPYSNATLIDRFDTLYGLTLDGRLAPGSSRASAEAELKIIAARLDHGEPGRKTNLTVSDGSWVSGATGSGSNRKSGRWAVAAVIGGLAMALLIASVNVTSLLLFRASARRSEMALRLSLGAPRGRLIRLQFLESFLLTAAAGAIGVYIAQAAATPLFAFLAEEAPRFSLAPDGLTLLYIFGLVLLAACVSGLAPALESLRVDLASSLKGSGCGGSALARGARLRGFLIAAQTGMSLALLVAAGLFARVFFQVAFANPGFATNRVIAVSVRFPMTGDSRADRAESAEVIRALVDRVRSVPGIRAATYANDMPVEGGGSRSAVKDGSFVPFRQLAVSPGYFETLGLPILGGRAFRLQDRRAGRESADAVISEAMARALWPGMDATGRRIVTVGGPVLNVIGVAADAGEPARSSLAAAYTFEEPGMGGSYLLARCDGDPQAAALAIQSAIREFKPEFMVAPMPLQKWLDRLASIVVRYGSVVWITGLMACALAIAGIYGVASFEVGIRTKEIGIRMALGARRRDILRQMLLSVGRPVAAGVLAGLWLSLGANTLLSAVSGTDSPMDPANVFVHLGCAALLAGAAAGAVLLSTLRRLRRDPVEALRLN